MGDELVSRIPYQCNNRSTGFHIQANTTISVILLTLFSLPSSHWCNARYGCLTRFMMAELVSESGCRGGVRNTRLSGSQKFYKNFTKILQKFYKNFRRGFTSPFLLLLHLDLELHCRNSLEPYINNQGLYHHFL